VLDRGGGQCVDAVLDRRRDDIRTGQAWRDQMDRVARRGRDDGVARPGQHPEQMREALLGADRADDLRLGVERDAEAALVELADRRAQLRDAAARRVPVVCRPGRRLAQLRDGDVRRRDVGVAEAEVDDVAAFAAQFPLQVVDGCEDVRRQIVDAPKLHFGKYCTAA
jgi:hypothetical protein